MIRLYHPQYGFTGTVPLDVVPTNPAAGTVTSLSFTNGVASVASLTDQQTGQLRLRGFTVIDDALSSPGDLPVFLADLQDNTSDAGATLKAALGSVSSPRRSGLGVAMGSTPLAESAAQNALDMDLIRRAGGDAIRVDLDWSTIETPQGTFNWTKPDALFDAADAQGLRVMFMPIGTPAWARTNGEPTKIYAPTNAANYGAFLTAAVNRYKSRGALGCHWWEIWNEPNASAAFGTPSSYSTYVALLGAAYTAIKAADATATVIVGGILRGGRESWTTQMLDTTWLAGIYGAGAQGKFDVLGYHPYALGYDPAATTPTGQPTGTNTVTNGTFDTDVSGWAADNGTFARVTTGQRTGAGALQYTGNGSGVGRAYFNNAVSAATTAMVATAWVKPSVDTIMQTSVNWLTSGFAYISTDDGDAILCPAGVWTQLGTRATSPGTAAFGVVKVQTTATVANGFTMLVDDVAFNPTSATDHGWNRLALMRAIMVANGDGAKPIWVTEVGQNTRGTGAVTEALQGTYITNAVTRLREFPYVQRFFYYMHRDASAAADAQSSYGMVLNDGVTLKAGFTAFKTAN